MFAIIVLRESLKRCSNDAQAEDTIAIAHDDDLRLIKDVVSPGRNAGTYPEVISNGLT
jgi:hypothetical protein